MKNKELVNIPNIHTLVFAILAMGASYSCDVNNVKSDTNKQAGLVLSLTEKQAILDDTIQQVKDSLNSYNISFDTTNFEQGNGVMLNVGTMEIKIFQLVEDWGDSTGRVYFETCYETYDEQANTTYRHPAHFSSFDQFNKLFLEDFLQKHFSTDADSLPDS